MILKQPSKHTWHFLGLREKSQHWGCPEKNIGKHKHRRSPLKKYMTLGWEGLCLVCTWWSTIKDRIFNKHPSMVPTTLHLSPNQGLSWGAPWDMRWTLYDSLFLPQKVTVLLQWKRVYPSGLIVGYVDERSQRVEIRTSATYMRL